MYAFRYRKVNNISILAGAIFRHISAGAGTDIIIDGDLPDILDIVHLVRLLQDTRAIYITKNLTLLQEYRGIVINGVCEFAGEEIQLPIPSSVRAGDEPPPLHYIPLAVEYNVDQIPAEVHVLHAHNAKIIVRNVLTPVRRVKLVEFKWSKYRCFGPDCHLEWKDAPVCIVGKGKNTIRRAIFYTLYGEKGQTGARCELTMATPAGQLRIYRSDYMVRATLGDKPVDKIENLVGDQFINKIILFGGSITEIGKLPSGAATLAGKLKARLAATSAVDTATVKTQIESLEASIDALAEKISDHERVIKLYSEKIMAEKSRVMGKTLAELETEYNTLIAQRKKTQLEIQPTEDLAELYKRLRPVTAHRPQNEILEEIDNLQDEIAVCKRLIPEIINHTNVVLHLQQKGGPRAMDKINNEREKIASLERQSSHLPELYEKLAAAETELTTAEATDQNKHIEAQIEIAKKNLPFVAMLNQIDADIARVEKLLEFARADKSQALIAKQATVRSATLSLIGKKIAMESRLKNLRVVLKNAPVGAEKLQEEYRAARTRATETLTESITKIEKLINRILTAVYWQRGQQFTPITIRASNSGNVKISRGKISYDGFSANEKKELDHAYTVAVWNLWRGPSLELFDGFPGIVDGCIQGESPDAKICHIINTPVGNRVGDSPTPIYGLENYSRRAEKYICKVCEIPVSAGKLEKHLLGKRHLAGGKVQPRKKPKKNSHEAQTGIQN